jgi:hypothetical protein
MGNTMHSLIDAVKNVVLTLLGVPTLVYRVSFMQGGPLFLTNVLGNEGKSLLLATTAEPAQNAQPPGSTLEQLFTDGLQLSITRSTEAKDTVAIQCLVSPRAWALPRFTLSATYMVTALAPAPVLGGPRRVYKWAATVIARDGDPTKIDPDTQIVGATHQVRNDGDGIITIALGTGGASVNSASTKIVERNPEDVYGTTVPWFVLETDIDCNSGLGWSRLRTSSNTVWPERLWSHPFAVTTPGKMPITAVGVGLAMTDGVGTPSVIVNDFSIYQWWAPMFWRPAVAGLIRYR